MREMAHNLNTTSGNCVNGGVNNQVRCQANDYQHSIDDRLQPEKEPVQFDVSHLRDAPAEVEGLVHNIKQVAQQFLYHWKTFPIILPPPVSACVDDEESLLRKKYHLRDLFVAPNFDELDAVAVDNKGEPRRLSNKQLECIRERGLHKDKYGKPKKLNATQLESIRRCGEFDVDSINFAGQTHRWRLSGLLQKGHDRRRERLLQDLALATRFLVVTARARIVSHCFSISESLKGLIAGLLKLIDIMIGLPSLQARNLNVKIREERCRYLVAELICRSEYEESLEMLCGFVRKQLRRAAMEKFEVERESCQLLPVSIPFVFDTPSGTPVDLRLFSRDIMKRAMPILAGILERETRGWFLHFRERLISELRCQKKTDQQIEEQVNEAVMGEYLQRVYKSILGHPEIEALGDGIGQLLVQQAQSVILMYRAVENVQAKLEKTKEILRKKIEIEHPVLSRIEPWMRDRMREAEAGFIEEYQWSAHEEALSLCNLENLQQTVYFLNRDLTFMREREPVLLKELGKVKTPTRNFQWPIQIWLPKNWIIRRSFQGNSEIIPTILSHTPTSITTPRADPSQPVFLVEREIVYTTTTRWPLWRWINYIARTWSWTWNAMFLFGVAVPWYSPVSFRALFLIEPFTTDLELSQLNGTLFPRKSSQTPTLSSRLITLWRHISKSRTQFEIEPDTGFIGKGMTRHINRLWNYGCKGLLGTFSILFIFPIICIIVSLTSLVIALSAFSWMPIVTLILHAFMALVMDLDTPQIGKNRYFVVIEALIWNICIQGFLQPIVALFAATCIYPIVSLVILIIAVIRYWIRGIWDAALFHILIKNRGRIPASDSFVVKRIAGPGLASNYYYQIRPEQALAAFEAKLELDELFAFQQEIERLITQPQRDFTQFVEACFSPFAINLAKTKEPYKFLEKEARDLISVLHEKLDCRRKDLQTGLSPVIRNKIKLSTYDLKMVIHQGAVMLERLYPSHVLSRLNTNEEDFWENKGLSIGDWAGLAGLMYADIFSLNFLQPLHDTDTRFKLEPQPGIDLSKYTNIINSAQLGGTNGPDLLGAIYAPRGNIQVQSPYLEISVFNPRVKHQPQQEPPSYTQRQQQVQSQLQHQNPQQQSLQQHQQSHHSGDNGKKEKLCGSSPLNHSTCSNNISTGDTRWQPWKRQMNPYNAEKLLIPLPIPHPAHVAITIYNRDSEEPICLDSEMCQHILRAIEESPSEMVIEVMNRLSAGIDSSFDSVASQSSLSLDIPSAKENATEGTSIKVEETQGNTYHWTLSNWAGGRIRPRQNSGSVKVDLASPEDVTLDTDTTRVMFSAYGTTV